MEAAALSLFCLALLICVLLEASVLYALGFGLLVFLAYGLLKGFSVKRLFKMALSGVRTVKNILFIFILIGVLTALWRASGTIAVIVSFASGLLRPATVLPMVFLLNCAVSLLTGTAFGSAATMGVISMSVAVAMGVDTVLAGGAVLAGAFFGDRCSPVSTSALLVSELTGTDIYANIRAMWRTAAVPFVLSTAAYLVFGLAVHGSEGAVDVRALFEPSFLLHWTALLPAAAMLVCAAFRLNVKLTMTASIVCAALCCLFLQHMTATELARAALLGYASPDPRIAPMMDGGGVVSMLRGAAIILISSCYAGIFRGTGMLESLRAATDRLSKSISPFGAVLCASLVTSVIACNQTLAVMLTHQLCSRDGGDASELAIQLENSVIVISPLVPWSIACAVPLATVGAPAASVLAAFFLWLLPVWTLAVELVRRGRKKADAAASAK